MYLLKYLLKPKRKERNICERILIKSMLYCRCRETMYENNANYTQKDYVAGLHRNENCKYQNTTEHKMQ